MILFVVALAVVTPSGDVFVDGRPHDAPPAVEVTDHLAEGDVMTLRVRGFGAFALAEIRQCQRDESSGALDGCTNSFPVQFGADGTARFQYELQQPAPCGPTDVAPMNSFGA